MVEEVSTKIKGSIEFDAYRNGQTFQHSTFSVRCAFYKFYERNRTKCADIHSMPSIEVK